MKARILIIDDEAEVRRGVMLKVFLAKSPAAVTVVFAVRYPLSDTLAS